jgi:hypothetical protein
LNVWVDSDPKAISIDFCRNFNLSLGAVTVLEENIRTHYKLLVKEKTIVK